MCKMTSVKERLPELDKEVLIYSKIWGFVVGQYSATKYKEETEYCFLIHCSINSADMTSVYDVVAWMPLPEVPKEIK